MSILVGIAGSGKGTQGKRLAEKFSLQYISTGEMLRQYATGAQKARMHSGELLEDAEIISMVSSVINESADPNKLLFDGFPRTIVQAGWLLERAHEGQFDLPEVFHLLASREAVKQRLALRARTDDHDEAIEERFNEYEKSTMPLLGWFKDNHVPVYEIDGERSVNEIQANLVEIVREKLNGK